MLFEIVFFLSIPTQVYILLYYLSTYFLSMFPYEILSISINICSYLDPGTSRHMESWICFYKLFTQRLRFASIFPDSPVYTAENQHNSIQFCTLLTKNMFSFSGLFSFTWNLQQSLCRLWHHCICVCVAILVILCTWVSTK
jgi:hypothetical protein